MSDQVKASILQGMLYADGVRYRETMRVVVQEAVEGAQTQDQAEKLERLCEQIIDKMTALHRLCAKTARRNDLEILGRAAMQDLTGIVETETNEGGDDDDDEASGGDDT